MNDKAIRDLLVVGPHPLPAKHVDSLLKHFERAIDHFRINEWEECTGRTGKFVEATLKTLAQIANVPAPTGRTFKVDTVVNLLRQLPGGAIDDAVRLVIPRCCTFIYEIASNRGGRHDADEVDPNEMDATAAVANSSWVLAELVRYAQKGAVDAEQASELVKALTERKYPLIENVEGRFYLHKHKKSAPDVALVALSTRYPARMSREELVATVRRNGFTEYNATVAVSRVARLADEDDNEQLRLLAPGRHKAEEIMKEAHMSGGKRRRTAKRRA
jgi:hypothetical protein